MAIRLTENVKRPPGITLTVNGERVLAYPGETIATLLFAENVQVFYRTRRGQARAPFCNMGTCFECLVGLTRKHAGSPFTWVRACMTPVEAGMQITTGSPLNPAGSPDDKN